MLKAILDAEETVKGMKILVNQRQSRKDANDTIIYECIAVEKKFERFLVKISNSKPLFEDSDSIPQNCQVEFKGLTGSAYIAGDNYKYVACSFKADSIEVIDDEQ